MFVYLVLLGGYTLLRLGEMVMNVTGDNLHTSANFSALILPMQMLVAALRQSVRVSFSLR